MGNQVLKYSALTTKIRGMELVFEDEGNVSKLANLDSVSEFVSFLKGTKSYQLLFQRYEETALHRGEIEEILNTSRYIDYMKIYRFANKQQRKFLSIYFMEFEVAIIKNILQSIFDKRTLSYNLSYFHEFFASHTKLNLEKLKAATTITELSQSLIGSVYEGVFDHVNPETATLFDYETCLDLFYFTYIWKIKDKVLTGFEHQLVSKTLGTKIDYLNIMWIYRGKKYLHSDTNTFYRFVIPIHYKLKKHQLVKLIEANSETEFLNILGKTYYKELSTLLPNHNFDQLYHNHMHKLYQSQVAKYPYSIAMITSHFYFRGEEVRKLISNLECIRYQLKRNEALTLMKKEGVTY